MTTATIGQPAERRVDVMLLLAVIAAVASILLTGAAFWLSYEHLHDVAAAHGLGHSAIRSWAWPATVDLFIVIGEVLILRAALLQRTDGWAIGLTVVGSGGSIALNVAGVGAHADGMNYVVAAVPPVAALLAFGALMRQIHGALAARLESATETPVQSAPPATVETPPTPAAVRPEPVVESAPGAPPAEAPERPKAPPRSAPKPAAKAPRKTPPKRPGKTPQSASRAEAKAAIEALYETKRERPLEGEMVAVLKALPGYPHTSRQHANKLRGEIEFDRPDLAAFAGDNVLALTGS